MFLIAQLVTIENCNHLAILNITHFASVNVFSISLLWLSMCQTIK